MKHHKLIKRTIGWLLLLHIVPIICIITNGTDIPNYIAYMLGMIINAIICAVLLFLGLIAYLLD